MPQWSTALSIAYSSRQASLRFFARNERVRCFPLSRLEMYHVPPCLRHRLAGVRVSSVFVDFVPVGLGPSVLRGCQGMLC
jgi:hypothetical protein